jgi:hypothetical protein
MVEHPFAEAVANTPSNSRVRFCDGRRASIDGIVAAR